MAAVCPPPAQPHSYAPYAEVPGGVSAPPPSSGYAYPNAYPQQYQPSAPIPAAHYGQTPPSGVYHVPSGAPHQLSYPHGSTPPDVPRAPFAQPAEVVNVPPRGASDVIDLLDELFASPNINPNVNPPQNQYTFPPTQVAPPSVSPVHAPSTSPVPPPTFEHGLGMSQQQHSYPYQGHVPGHVTPPAPPVHAQTYGYHTSPASVSPVPTEQPAQTQWTTTMQPIQSAPPAPYAPQTHYTQEAPQAWQGTAVAGVVDQRQHPGSVSPVPPQPTQVSHPGYPISPPWQQQNATPVEAHQVPPPTYTQWSPVQPTEHQQQPSYPIPVHTAYGVPPDVQSAGYGTYQPSPVVATPVSVVSSEYNADETAAQLKATEDRIAELKRQIAERARAAGQGPAPQPAANHASQLQSDEELARRLQEEENESGRGGTHAPPPVMDAAALRRQQELEDEAFARQLEQQERQGTGPVRQQQAPPTVRRVSFASVSEQQTLDDEALARQLQAEEERAVSLRESFAMNRPPPMAPPQPQQAVRHGPEWVPDSLADACMNEGCGVKFRTLGAHRHHCRGCGLVFCDSCSKYRRRSAQGKDERVCFTCHNR